MDNYNCEGKAWWEHAPEGCAWCAEHRSAIIDGMIAMLEKGGLTPSESVRKGGSRA